MISVSEVKKKVRSLNIYCIGIAGNYYIFIFCIIFYFYLLFNTFNRWHLFQFDSVLQRQTILVKFERAWVKKIQNRNVSKSNNQLFSKTQCRGSTKKQMYHRKNTNIQELNLCNVIKGTKSASMVFLQFFLSKCLHFYNC